MRIIGRMEQREAAVPPAGARGVRVRGVCPACIRSRAVIKCKLPERADG